MRQRESERGSVLAEFAIVSTAVLTLIFGIIDFSRALYTYHLISEAARLGTRYAIVRGSTACAGGTPDPLQSYVSGQAPGIDPNSMIVKTSCTQPTVCSSTVTTSCVQTTDCTGPPYNGLDCLVTVTVTYPFSFVVPLAVNPTMTSASTMAISQ